MLNFSKNLHGFEGFDAWLQAISDATNPVKRWAQSLVGKRILWFVSDSSADTEPAQIAQLIISETAKVAPSRPAFVQLHACSDEAKAVEQTVQMLNFGCCMRRNGGKFDLLITRYGNAQAVRTLRAINDERQVSTEIRCPVVIVDGSTDNATNIDERKREVMNLGSSKYCTRFDCILQDIHDVLASAVETM